MLEKIKRLPLHLHFKIRTGLLIAALIIMLTAQIAGRGMAANIGIAGGMLFMLSGSIWHILFLRCPHCGRLFDPRGKIPKYCPECGQKPQ